VKAALSLGKWRESPQTRVAERITSTLRGEIKEMDPLERLWDK